MDWAQLLVILLAVLLMVFLITAIILIVFILKLSQQIKQTAANAERTVHAIENSVNNFNKAALPFAAAKSIIGRVRKSRRTSDKEGS